MLEAKGGMLDLIDGAGRVNVARMGNLSFQEIAA
jgi:hypothetical protein